MNGDISGSSGSNSTSPPADPFRELVAKIIQTPKAEVDRREAEYQREREGKPKPGPKPKSS